MAEIPLGGGSEVDFIEQMKMAEEAAAKAKAAEEAAKAKKDKEK